jgi:hypothetical protein
MSIDKEESYNYCGVCGHEIPPDDIDRFVLGKSDVCYDCYLKAKVEEFQDMGWEDEMADF